MVVLLHALLLGIAACTVRSGGGHLRRGSAIDGIRETALETGTDTYAMSERRTQCVHFELSACKMGTARQEAWSNLGVDRQRSARLALQLVVERVRRGEQAVVYVAVGFVGRLARFHEIQVGRIHCVAAGLDLRADHRAGVRTCAETPKGLDESEAQ